MSWGDLLTAVIGSTVGGAFTVAALLIGFRLEAQRRAHDAAVAEARQAMSLSMSMRAMVQNLLPEEEGGANARLMTFQQWLTSVRLLVGLVEARDWQFAEIVERWQARLSRSVDGLFHGPGSEKRQQVMRMLNVFERDVSKWIANPDSYRDLDRDGVLRAVTQINEMGH